MVQHTQSMSKNRSGQEKEGQDVCFESVGRLVIEIQNGALDLAQFLEMPPREVGRYFFCSCSSRSIHQSAPLPPPADLFISAMNASASARAASARARAASAAALASADA